MYQYHYRPGYNSDKLLIEFIDGVENKQFFIDLMSTLAGINPRIEDVADLWMNDEILVSIASDIGSFTLSKDVWGFAFITAPDDQPCLEKLNELLSANKLYEKIEVNFEDYKASEEAV